jgi:hypothetical protein
MLLWPQITVKRQNVEIQIIDFTNFPTLT